jgi:SNF2 family DNA or RNA helicase
MGIDGHLIVKFRVSNRIYYTNYYPDKNLISYIFFEIINKSPLWTIKYEVSTQPAWNASSSYYYDVKFRIFIETALINDYINTSFGLNNIIADMYLNAPNFNDTDFTNKSIIPYFDPVKPPKNFKLKLYDYQQRTLAKMLQMEKNQTDFTLNYTYNINFNGINILFDPVSNTKVDKEFKFKIKTKGGVLSDEMGLGKTISSIALITSHPAPTNLPNTKNTNNDVEKINSRATLVICPNHLVKQWEGEIRRCDPNLTIKIILTKSDYNGLTFNDFIVSDIIITSHQFIMNFNFYPALYYQRTTPASFNFTNRFTQIKTFLKDTLRREEFKIIKQRPEPIFEFFNFHRLILDEGHEIFGEMLGSAAMGRYMSQWVSTIDANYFWYVSGTPFVNFTGIKNCAKFIHLELQDSNRDLTFDYSNISESSSSRSVNFMSKQYIWNNILEKIVVRHRKTDVANQIKIPGYQERLVWLKFTDLERQLYDAKKNKVSDEYLQQLCCHPLVVESSKKIFGDVEVDLTVMQDKLIEYHKNNYESNKLKLSKLDPTRQEYHMLKKTYETHMSESKYLFTILEKMKKPESIEDENCSICMDCLDNPALTACGHLFCYECIKMCLGDKKRCPMCKTDLTGKDLLVMNLKKKSTEETNPLILKYGSKLGKLISIIRHLVAQEETRIIVFSQWDDMLTLIGKTLSENGIENCFVKGNVWSRNAAIRKFKAGKNMSGDDNKVIMLSLKNAASGTNLTEATHIFFVEPINAPREESRAIEGQAIARACRVGQKQQIMLMRILIEKTIEEEVYRKYYNPDVNVSFEEQTYFVEPPKTKIVNADNDGEIEIETTSDSERSVKSDKIAKTRKSVKEDSDEEQERVVEKPVKTKKQTKPIKKVDSNQETEIRPVVKLEKAKKTSKSVKKPIVESDSESEEEKPIPKKVIRKRVVDPDSDNEIEL